MSDTNNAVIQAAYNQNYRDGADVTKSDTGTHNYNALVAGTAGDIKVTFIDDSVATVSLASGIPVNYKVKRVWSTGTTAAKIVGLNARV